MQKFCRVSNKTFTISDEEVGFYEKVSPTINGKKYLIPLPSLSPEERLRRRWTFRNEHALYNNRCSKTGKAVVSMFPPSLPITIYEQNLWWDKSWDGTEYGRDSSFLYGCKSCSDCFGCFNLRHKQYCWLNKQLTRAEFEELRAKMDLGNYEIYQKVKADFLERIQAAPREYAFLTQCENCSGNVLSQSHDSYNCFDSEKNEDSRYIISTKNIRDSFDIEHTYNAELSLEVMAATNIYQNFFCFYCINSQNIFYSYLASGSKNCFGCAALKNQEHCILNKKYTKEQYEELVPRIIAHMEKTGEWGEFFPMSVSLHGYNESLAADYFPLTKEQATTMRANWCEYEAPAPNANSIIEAKDLPLTIKEVTDDILNTAIRCAASGKLFKITKQELQFYRDNNLPMPRVSLDVRSRERLKLRLPRKLWQRHCDCQETNHEHINRCEVQFESPYANDRAEKVYCEKCYLKQF